ncbi:hypothetical protein DER44DRAFT_120972 [Fusarium oxysporum]|nr:hypothetical protein DER44DRAFT_120972 [Fusarium oxysporum]
MPGIDTEGPTSHVVAAQFVPSSTSEAESKCLMNEEELQANSIKSPSKRQLRLSQRRAARACLVCRARRVRCDVTRRQPCGNCVWAGKECTIKDCDNKRIPKPSPSRPNLQPVQEQPQEPPQKPPQKPLQEPLQHPLQESLQELLQETLQEPLQEQGQDPWQNLWQESWPESCPESWQYSFQAPLQESLQELLHIEYVCKECCKHCCEG